jgi:hypothetical protein
MPGMSVHCFVHFGLPGSEQENKTATPDWFPSTFSRKSADEPRDSLEPRSTSALWGNGYFDSHPSWIQIFS